MPDPARSMLHRGSLSSSVLLGERNVINVCGENSEGKLHFGLGELIFGIELCSAGSRADTRLGVIDINEGLSSGGQLVMVSGEIDIVYGIMRAVEAEGLINGQNADALTCRIGNGHPASVAVSAILLRSDIMLEVLADGGIINPYLTCIIQIGIVLRLASAQIAYIFVMLRHSELKAEAGKLKYLRMEGGVLLLCNRIGDNAALSRNGVGNGDIKNGDTGISAEGQVSADDRLLFVNGIKAHTQAVEHHSMVEILSVLCNESSFVIRGSSPNGRLNGRSQQLVSVILHGDESAFKLIEGVYPFSCRHGYAVSGLAGAESCVLGLAESL